MKVVGTVTRYYNGPLYKSAYIKDKTIEIAKTSNISLISLPITKKVRLIDDMLLKLDGLYITGNEEVNPFLFLENPIDNMSKFDILQDEVELLYIERAIKNNIPLLLCGRGLNLLNIYFGGDLYRSIEKQHKSYLYHRGKEEKTYHLINLGKDTFLEKTFLKENLTVPSNHKQAIRILGDKMKIVATSSDGIIEAVEPIDSTNKYLGLQFTLEDFEEGAVILDKFFNRRP
ncbi:MAG: gamma-glutamyl-gamma-aminobutyrate hydrolase family protein [Lagierella massiliensis]|nr:gamma-glutamyl-gamma-aminobutyrate hydrolase family protein [Lagierella massiliensis]